MTEQRWKDPAGNEWVTIETPGDEIKNSWPTGTVEIEMEISQPPPIDDRKRALKSGIDVAAEVERRKYITAGSGQAMTYMQKADEAARYLAATDPVPADYALLSAEVGITAPTLGEVAEIVNAAFAQWQIIGGMIEAARLGTKAAIDAAETVEAAQAAADSVIWPNT